MDDHNRYASFYTFGCTLWDLNNEGFVLVRSLRGGATLGEATWQKVRPAPLFPPVEDITRLKKKKKKKKKGKKKKEKYSEGIEGVKLEASGVQCSRLC